MAIITSRAYDCSLIDTDGTELEVVPCMNRGPTWQIVGNQVRRSLCLVIFAISTQSLVTCFTGFCPLHPSDLEGVSHIVHDVFPTM